MKLQPITLYRIYITINDEKQVHKVISEIEKEYNPRKITLTKSRNVRGFIYLELEIPEQGIEKEIENAFKRNGITSVKIDVLEIKRPL